LLYLYNMKLIQILEGIINEAVFVNTLDVNGEPVTVLKTYESMRSTGLSNYTGRAFPEDILNSMEDIYDIIVDQANIVLNKCKRKCSLLVRDNRPEFRFDYQLFIKNNKEGLVITINTSMKHPMSLRNEFHKTREIIISKDENIRIKEDYDYSIFTKIVKGDIIIHIMK